MQDGLDLLNRIAREIDRHIKASNECREKGITFKITDRLHHEYSLLPDDAKARIRLRVMALIVYEVDRHRRPDRIRQYL